MLPLRDDWFFRPLFYIQSSQTKLQQLAQAIFVYSEKFILADENAIFGLTPSDLVLLSSHFLFQSEDDKEKIAFNQATFDSISDLLDAIQAKFKQNQSELRFESSEWLLKTYPAIFNNQRFFSSLSSFLNENSLDQNPIVYKILILAIESSEEGTYLSEQKRSFLSDIQEILPLLIRNEKDYKVKNRDAFTQHILKFDAEVSVPNQFVEKIVQNVESPDREDSALWNCIMKLK